MSEVIHRFPPAHGGFIAGTVFAGGLAGMRDTMALRRAGRPWMVEAAVTTAIMLVGIQLFDLADRRRET